MTNSKEMPNHFMALKAMIWLLKLCMGRSIAQEGLNGGFNL